MNMNDGVINNDTYIPLTLEFRYSDTHGRIHILGYIYSDTHARIQILRYTYPNTYT